jgi:uncharacterized protein with PIN domain
MSVRFHLDEHLSPAIAEGLRVHGMDVTTTEDAHLSAASDEEHVEFALNEDRVIATHDQDFLRIDASGVLHAGIVFAAANKLSIGEWVHSLLLIDACCIQDELRGKVEYL